MAAARRSVRWALVLLCGLGILRLPATSAAVDPTPAQTPLTLELSCDVSLEGDTYLALIGAPVVFECVVSNTGTETITVLSVDEPQLGHFGDIAALAPGESTALDLTSDSAEGLITATVAGLDSRASVVQASGSLSLERFFGDTFEADPWVRAGSSTAKAAPGDTVRFTATYGNEKDTLVGATTLTAVYDAAVFDVADAGGALPSPGRLVWELPAGMTSDDAARAVAFSLRVRDDAAATVGTVTTSLRIENESDVDTSDNAASVTTAIDHYLGFTPPPHTVPSSSTRTSDTRRTSSAGQDEPFLPFTGAEDQRSLVIAGLFGLAGVVLRRIARSA